LQELQTAPQRLLAKLHVAGLHRPGFRNWLYDACSTECSLASAALGLGRQVDALARASICTIFVRLSCHFLA